MKLGCIRVYQMTVKIYGAIIKKNQQNVQNVLVIDISTVVLERAGRGQKNI